MGALSRRGHARGTARLVIAAALGAVLTGTVLVGVGFATPADPLTGAAAGLPAPGRQEPAASGPAATPDSAASETPGAQAPVESDGAAAPADPAAPAESDQPADPALPVLPDVDPKKAGPGLPRLPALPANPLDPVDDTPQTADAQEEVDEFGKDKDKGESAAEPESMQPAVVDGAVRIPGTPCSGDVQACVDLTTLRSWLIVDGEVRRGPVDVRVGDEFGPTPVGRFQVEYKDDHHVSRQFGTPMNYAVFFADGGIAFHEGRQDTDSAGCVKLTHDDAVAWFYALQLGDGVQIVRTAGS